MTAKEAWVEKWKCHIAGMALFGTVEELSHNPIQRTARALKIPAQVEALLGKMFDDMGKMTANGQSQTVVDLGPQQAVTLRVKPTEARK